ncbi:AfsR/SARP family transcriptional regulator [Streptomyces niveus]|uniref:AfsR/SARP family transcriptional regulator n=1 Tax=Streptomyces niveus TaxID=193462 RepID=UPI0003C5A1A3|nr:BTAD domain-containing putative transcriptional regulator [Streptomyces niveus]EST27168.1 hypothetical protein M877_17170 [Streptomyces niveus NCIMB 11891]
MLGPLELWAKGRRYRLGSPQERRILAILLVAEGRAVPVSRLIDQAWDGAPPPSAVDTLRSYISRLRSRLRIASDDQLRLEFLSRTYSLKVAPEAVDLLQFRQLCRQGRQATERGDIETAIPLFRRAEALRRAEPLADLTGLWAASVRERLREELREVTETRIRLELSQGRHAQLISELKELANHTPVVEPVVADLMTALYRCGRPAESLAAYRTARRRLREEVGLEPSHDLQQLHEQILRRAPSLLQHTTSVRPRPTPLDNLPRDIPEFTGREEEIGLLMDKLGGRGIPTALPLAVVHGMPGVGKTRLAIRVVNLLRDRYQDGRVYLNLRSHGGEYPLDPGNALAALLTMLGLPPGNLPAELDERAALWRELMARRKAIVVLDDAHDASQVRPLLPGTSGCSVLVTSRHRLTDLEGSWSLPLEVPSPSQASDLFTRIAGSARITDRDALRRVVDLCGCHPLALHLAAARLRHRVSRGIEDLAEQLAEAPSLLDEIDAPAGISAAFGFCYAELKSEHRLLFHRLSLHPGPDITVGVAAALVDTDAVGARHSLDALLDGHLIEESGRDRVRLHDLLRAFGHSMGAREDPENERNAAVERMLDRYLADAVRADRLAHPHRPRLDLPMPASARGASLSTRIHTADEGKAWLDLERANLLAAARMASVRSRRHALLFPHVLAHSFMAWGAWEAGTELYSVSLDAARGCEDPVVTAQLLVETAALLWSRGAHNDALTRATRALAIGQERNREVIQAQALFEMGRAHLISTRRTEAVECFGRALVLYRAADNTAGEAETLNLLGIALCHAGRYQEATERFRTALEIHTHIGDRLGQAKTLNNVGEVSGILGRHAEARSYYDRSLSLVRRIGGRSQLSNLYTNIGNTCRATGDSEESLSHYRRALNLYRETGDPRGEADVLICIGTTYLETGSHLKARLHFQMAEHVAERIGDRYARQQALVGTAYTQFAARQFSLSMTTFQEALRAAEEIDIPLARGRALEGMGMVTESTLGAEAAREYFERSYDLYLALGLPDAESILRRLNAPGAANP